MRVRDLELTCRLDLTDTAGKTVNTVAYRGRTWHPDTGEFRYKVTANRDTRDPGGK